MAQLGLELRVRDLAATEKEDIRQKYERFARWYDLAETIQGHILGTRRLRRELVRRASGNILEVAAGTGANFPYYPRGCRVTAVGLSPSMLAKARRRAERLGLDVSFGVMDAEALPFPGLTFDTVVSSLSLCTSPDPVAALREMARVCRADGRILLLEHGRSDRNWLAGWQDRRADRHAKQLGCRWNREPLDLAHRAGLRLIAAQRVLLGVFHVIEAIPR